jgi:hypothetical protein
MGRAEGGGETKPLAHRSGVELFAGEGVLTAVIGRTGVVCSLPFPRGVLLDLASRYRALFLGEELVMAPIVRNRG